MTAPPRANFGMVEPSFVNRRVLLRLMLGALAFAGAAGVLAILLPGRHELGSVVGTAVATAIGCLLMMTAARSMERSEHRAGAIGYIGLVFAEYLLTVLLIWDVPALLAPGSNAQEHFFSMMLVVAFAGIPTAGLLRSITLPSMHIAGRVGLTLLAIAFVTMTIGIWIPSARWDFSDVARAGLFIELYSFPIMFSLVGFRRGDRRFWRWIGVGASVFAGSLLISHDWTNSVAEPGHVFVWATVLAVCIAHANISLHCPLSGAQVWLRWATIAAMGITGILVGLVATSSESQDEFLARLATASGICAACGTAAMVIITVMNRRVERPMIAPAEVRDLSLTCPGCQKRQTVPLGDSACVECGLRFSIKIAEPRCETCGYLLYRLTSSRCPECGTSVPPIVNQTVQPA